MLQAKQDSRIAPRAILAARRGGACTCRRNPVPRGPSLRFQPVSYARTGGAEAASRGAGRGRVWAPTEGGRRCARERRRERFRRGSALLRSSREGLEASAASPAAPPFSGAPAAPRSDSGARRQPRPLLSLALAPRSGSWSSFRLSPGSAYEPGPVVAYAGRRREEFTSPLGVCCWDRDVAEERPRVRGRSGVWSESTLVSDCEDRV